MDLQTDQFIESILALRCKMNRNRNDLAKAIINIIESKGAYVFGGYVRDLYTGEPFTDLDIYIPHNTTTRSVLESLRNQGYKVHITFEHNDEDYPRLSGINRRRYDVCHIDSGLSIPVDLVKSLTNEDSPFRKGTDADINFLKITAGFTYVAFEDMSMGQVLKNIRAHKFEAGSQMSEYRINKLLAKGYTQIGKDSISPITCSKCGGTGLLDFEFYTRSCECKLK